MIFFWELSGFVSFNFDGRLVLGTPVPSFNPVSNKFWDLHKVGPDQL